MEDHPAQQPPVAAEVELARVHLQSWDVWIAEAATLVRWRHRCRRQVRATILRQLRQLLLQPRKPSVDPEEGRNQVPGPTVVDHVVTIRTGMISIIIMAVAAGRGRNRGRHHEGQGTVAITIIIILTAVHRPHRLMLPRIETVATAVEDIIDLRRRRIACTVIDHLIETLGAIVEVIITIITPTRGIVVCPIRLMVLRHRTDIRLHLHLHEECLTEVGAATHSLLIIVTDQASEEVKCAVRAILPAVAVVCVEEEEDLVPASLWVARLRFTFLRVLDDPPMAVPHHRLRNRNRGIIILTIRRQTLHLCHRPPRSTHQVITTHRHRAVDQLRRCFGVVLVTISVDRLGRRRLVPQRRRLRSLLREATTVVTTARWMTTIVHRKFSCHCGHPLHRLTTTSRRPRVLIVPTATATNPKGRVVCLP